MRKTKRFNSEASRDGDIIGEYNVIFRSGDTTPWGQFYIYLEFTRGLVINA